MGKNKFILETLDEEGNVLTETQYKSYKAIEKDIGCTYMCIRKINRITEGIENPKHGGHRELQYFLKKYRIKNIPFEN